jgi:hypothetical protein
MQELNGAMPACFSPQILQSEVLVKMNLAGRAAKNIMI